MAHRWHSVKKLFATVRTWLKEEKSIWAWLVNLLIAFIIIKFIIYPGLGLIFGSSLPVVAVVSSSMDHSAIDGVVCGVSAPPSYNDNFDGYWATCGSWYEQRGITKTQFQNFSFSGGFKKGDIMVLWGRSTIHLGDIVVYNSNQPYPIIHRVWNMSATTVSTKGDHNPAPIEEYVLVQGTVAYTCENNGQPASCFFGKPVTRETPGAVGLIDETAVPRTSIIGKAVFRIPWLGYVKIWFTDIVTWIGGIFH